MNNKLPFFLLHPHLLTTLRLITGPLFFILFTEREWLGLSPEECLKALFIVFAISEISDVLDGYFARKYGIVSELGKILDPMADSISRLSFFLAFTTPPISVPLILVLPLFYRDVIISALRILCGLSGFALAARWTGKFKAVLQASITFCILILLLAFNQEALSASFLKTSASILIGLASLFSIISGIEYLLCHKKLISKFLTQAECS